MSKLSASLEDYLETILNLQKKNELAKVVDIANELNVAKSSVTDALKSLKKKKLINYAAYKPVELTAKGKKLATNVAKRHELLFEFFNKTLGLEDFEAIDNACKIEHVITENALSKISELMNKQ